MPFALRQRWAMLIQHKPTGDTGLCGCAGAQSASVFSAVAHAHQYECADDEQVSRWLRGVLLGPHERAHLIRSPWVPRHLQATKGSACLAQEICGRIQRGCNAVQVHRGPTNNMGRSSQRQCMCLACLHADWCTWQASRPCAARRIKYNHISNAHSFSSQPRKYRTFLDVHRQLGGNAPSVSPACCFGERPRLTTVKTTENCDGLVHLISANNIFRCQVAVATRQRTDQELRR